MKYKDPKHVQMVETKLRIYAMHSGEIFLFQENAGLPCIIKWHNMKPKLEKRYIPTTYRQDLSKRIANFTQGYMTVVEYCDEFHVLSSRAEVDELEYITIGCYKRGFRKHIRDIICLSTINTIFALSKLPLMQNPSLFPTVASFTNLL